MKKKLGERRGEEDVQVVADFVSRLCEVWGDGFVYLVYGFFLGLSGIGRSGSVGYRVYFWHHQQVDPLLRPSLRKLLLEKGVETSWESITLGTKMTFGIASDPNSTSTTYLDFSR